MTDIVYENLKDALVDWTYASGSVYLTDEEEGPEGVIAGTEGYIFIRKEEDATAVYYKGNDEYLELLRDLLDRVSNAKIKLYVDGDVFVTTFVG